MPAPDDLGDAQAAGLLRTALRIGFTVQRRPVPVLASIAVEPRPYQLVPLLMAMRQPTRPAGDLRRRWHRQDRRVRADRRRSCWPRGKPAGLAVLCSPALAEQWQDELRTKFGINAELILASTVPRLERALAWGQTLFERHQIVIISTDFIKSPRHRDDFLKHCPDLVIVDEAHTCVPADAAHREGSAQLRYDLLSRVAKDKTGT